jgi:hypothetical protein
MVLLHHHVVPGLGGDTRPRPEATAVRGNQGDHVALADCEDLALTAAPADPAISSPAVDTFRAA